MTKENVEQGMGMGMGMSEALACRAGARDQNRDELVRFVGESFRDVVTNHHNPPTKRAAKLRIPIPIPMPCSS